MDINQTVRMIEWLDEERRRDKTSIARLEERLALQQELLDALQMRLSTIQGEHRAPGNGRQDANPERERKIVEELRSELLERLAAGDARRRSAEAEGRRRSEELRSQLDRPMRELAGKVAELERRQGGLPSMQTENDRLSGALSDLGQRVEELFRRMEDPERRLTLLEEQRRQDNRSQVASAAGIPELQRQIDAFRGKLDLLENLILRNEGQMQDLASAESERREANQAFIDAQGLQTRQHEQRIESYSARFSEYDANMERFARRFETWAEVFREMKALVERFERSQERLDQRFNEQAEVQRIAEERLRQDWESQSGEEQRRRKQFTLANDEVWRSHDREFERFVQTFGDLRERIPPLEDALQRLWDLERERMHRRHEHDQSLLQKYDRGSHSEILPAGGDNPGGLAGIRRGSN